MTVKPEIAAEIIRLYHAEHWRKTTIARQLGLHHSTVSRILARCNLPAAKTGKSSKVDPFIPFITSTLEKFPKLNATRLHRMVKERGYTGGVDHFRDIVRQLRPNTAEAYLRLSTLPGEQAQVDWGSFGKIKIGEAEHRLLAFVMVLSWSRRIFLKFYLGDATGNFLRGHAEAFEHFNRVPREILYDNLKTAVIERVESAIRFNSDLLDLASHYRFAPRPVPVARPTSKGRVERAIRYIRTSFFAARDFSSIEQLNEQAALWCAQEACERRCPQDRKLSVQEAFEAERERMLPLPETDFPIFDRKVVVVGKSPYVRFEGNDYSVPHTFVRRTLLVEATLTEVRIVDGLALVASHARSFDRGEQIESPEHISALETEKRNASRERGMNRILNVVPSSRQFFRKAAERGHNMGRLTQVLIYLLDLYGSRELETAISEVLAADRIHSEAIRAALERRRALQGLPPPVKLQFLKDRRVDEVRVRPKSLKQYDQIVKGEDSNECT